MQKEEETIEVEVAEKEASLNGDVQKDPLTTTKDPQKVKMHQMDEKVEEGLPEENKQEEEPVQDAQQSKLNTQEEHEPIAENPIAQQNSFPDKPMPMMPHMMYPFPNYGKF